MGYWTSICNSHTGGYTYSTCSYHRGRGRNTLNYSNSPDSGDIITSLEWRQLRDYLNWERDQRATGGISYLPLDAGVTIDDSYIETLRDGIETINGSGNSERPWETYQYVEHYDIAESGAKSIYYSYSGPFSGAGGWNYDAVVQWANIDDNDYQSQNIGAGYLVHLRNRLQEAMQDCVCNSNCGANSVCGCYTSYCNSHYFG